MSGIFEEGSPQQVASIGQYKETKPSLNDGQLTFMQLSQEGSILIGTSKTSASLLVSEQDLTASFADFGDEIDVVNYTRVGIWITRDVNDSTDVELKVLGLYESSGTEFEISGIADRVLWSTSGSDGSTYYEFDVGTIPYIKLQAKAGTLGSTPGDLTIYINKQYR